MNFLRFVAQNNKDFVIFSAEKECLRMRCWIRWDTGMDVMSQGVNVRFQDFLPL